MTTASMWPSVRLEDVVVEGPTNGYSPPAASDGRGTLSLKLSATTQGHFVLNETTVKRLHENIPSDSSLWLRPGDLLVQRSNTAELVGTAAIYDGPPHTYIYPDLMMRLRFHDSATTRWICRYMNSPMGRRYFATVAAGAAGSMPKISGAKLKGMPLPLPPLEEQRRVADILDKADAIRRKRKEAIALTEELLRSAFLEMFGDPVTNPKGWETQDVGALCEVIVDCVNRTAPTVEHETPYKMIRTTNVKGGQVLLDEVKYVARETFDLWNRRCTPRRGDVLLTREAPVGEAGILRSDDKLFLGQRLMLYRTNPKVLLPEYLVQAFREKHLQSQFDAHGSGSTVKHLSLPICRSLLVRVPPLELQRRFVEVARVLQQKRGRHFVAQFQAQDLFASLVHRVFGGELASASGVKAQLALFEEAGSQLSVS